MQHTVGRLGVIPSTFLLTVGFIFYLNNRVFLSRNYRPIVGPRKFDVVKTNIWPRSEASRANMLVLKGPSTLTTKLALNCLKYM